MRCPDVVLQYGEMTCSFDINIEIYAALPIDFRIVGSAKSHQKSDFSLTIIISVSW